MSRTAGFALASLVTATLIGCPVSRSSPWRTLDSAPGEPFTHATAKAIFPPQIAKFRRGEIRAYDRSGRDLSATYYLAAPGETVLATLYVYPARSAEPVSRDELKQHFGRVQFDVRQVHPNAMLIDARQVETLHNGQPTAGYVATFAFTDTFAGQHQPVHSSVYLFSHGPWFVKYRITYPEAQRGTVEADVKDFVAMLRWDEPPSDESRNAEPTAKSAAAASVGVNQRFDHGWTLLAEAARSHGGAGSVRRH